ncbi:uncharacterized protein DS421_17g577030 [Arachis hypogaea]|nr:uncharacterized protein DS421_17g577030 [Arachis hypogaea]
MVNNIFEIHKFSKYFVNREYCMSISNQDECCKLLRFKNHIDPVMITRKL